jgi:hypothetical protein
MKTLNFSDSLTLSLSLSHLPTPLFFSINYSLMERSEAIRKLNEEGLIFSTDNDEHWMKA